MAATVSATKTHRVHCPDHSTECRSEAAAQQLRLQIEMLGACQQFHAVEVRVGDEWVATHIARAAEICATPAGGVVESVDGNLIVTWRHHITGGSADMVDLSSDGREAKGGWCTCANVGQDGWVRYERWSLGVGRASHGWVHNTCRKVLQSG